MAINFSNLTFEESREAIRDALIKKFGRERIRRTDTDNDNDYDIVGDYGDRSVTWTVYVSMTGDLSINMGIESGFVEEDKELRGDAKEMFRIIGLTPSENNKNRNTDTFTGNGTFEFLSEEKRKMKKLGKYKDFLKL